MSKFINQTKKTVAQISHMPHSAYKALEQLAHDHNAEIAKTDKGWLTLTFDEVNTAKNVAKKFESDYAKAHDAYVPKSEREPKPAPAKKTNPVTNGKGSIKVSKAVKGALAPYAGKGKSANHDVADVLRGMGIVPNGIEWDYWKTIR